MGVSTEAIRNVAIVGHGATGKTSLVEHILAAAKVIERAETVETGKTVSDFLDEEIARRISIRTSVTHAMWKGSKINMLDAPGSSDFVGEVIAALRVTDSAVVAVAAEAGVQIETIKIWRRLDQLNLPRIVFVNKMDKEHADFDKVLADLRARFKVNFVPLTVPVGAAATFKSVIDVLSPAAGADAEATAAAEEARLAVIEAAADGEEALMEKYLSEEKLTDVEIRRGLRAALAAGKCVPVFCGAALQDAGLEPLLDFLASSAPAPTPEATGEADGKEVTRKTARSEPFSCFVFKTHIDQFSGRLSFVKVVSGRLASDSEIVNYRNSDREKASKIYTCQGKKLEETTEVVAGDLGVLLKLESVSTNDTLGDPAAPLQYPHIALPQPVHAVAISAVAKKDEDKLNQLINRACEEDPSMKLAYNRETRENVLSTMGELQLTILLEGIRKTHKIEAATKLPRVAYRETITKSAGAEYQHKKQTGGHGQYAKVVLEVAPLERGKHFNFVNGIHGGAISKGYVPGVEKGIIEAMDSGILAGYPVVDIEAKIVDGKEHPVDSSEMAFKLAARGALRASMEKASPVLLEPIMNLEVIVDDQYLGDVLSDLSSRRGRVLGQEPIGAGMQIVRVQVPQAELQRYSIDLKSMTSGTASFEIAFDHYDPVAGRVAEEVIKAAKAAGVEEES
jgi:elongation factor G